MTTVTKPRIRQTAHRNAPKINVNAMSDRRFYVFVGYRLTLAVLALTALIVITH